MSALTIRNLKKTYGNGVEALKGIELTVEKGDFFALLGPNGAGKSTLIRTLVGELTALEGRLKRDPDLAVGYFHQQQVDRLAADDTPYQLINRAHPKWTEQQVRNELGAFGFHGDAVFEPVGRFSGGEKARLALALIVHEKPALLLLDEPANHLDLEMREALTLALQEFEGAVVLVSHDRHLLETTVDEFQLVAEGTVRAFDGDLDDYARWLQQARREANAAARTEPAAGRDDARQRRQDAAKRREQLRPLKKEVEKLEKALDRESDALTEVETALADETLYTDAGRKDELQALLARQGDLKNRREELEMALLEAMEKLEEAEASL